MFFSSYNIQLPAYAFIMLYLVPKQTHLYKESSVNKANFLSFCYDLNKKMNTLNKTVHVLFLQRKESCGVRANVSALSLSSKHLSLLMRLNGEGWILIVVLHHEMKPFDTNWKQPGIHWAESTLHYLLVAQDALMERRPADSDHAHCSHTKKPPLYLIKVFF